MVEHSPEPTPNPAPRAALMARALRWLAQREYSRHELRARLLVAARGLVASARQRGSTDSDDAATRDEATAQAWVDSVLAALHAQALVSDERFIDSRLHAREARWGLRRIRHELQQHGLALAPEQQQRLQSTERQRAQAVWARRFGPASAMPDATGTPAAPTTPSERARQMRFLAGRGFSADVIRQVCGGGDGGHGDDDGAQTGPL